MRHFEYVYDVFCVPKKLYKLSKLGVGGNLDKIQKNSHFFSWNLPIESGFVNGTCKQSPCHGMVCPCSERRKICLSRVWGREAVLEQLAWGEAGRGETEVLASRASPEPGSRPPGRRGDQGPHWGWPTQGLRSSDGAGCPASPTWRWNIQWH